MENLLFTGGTGFLGRTIKPILEVDYVVTTCGITPEDEIRTVSYTHLDMSLKDNFFERVDPKILSSITPEDLAFTRSGLHCDLHPRWSRDGRWVLFDSIHEGTRQLYAVDVNNLIK